MKDRKEISRRKFLASSACGGIGAVSAGCMISSCSRAGSNENNKPEFTPTSINGISIRPYLLLCAICRIGQGNIDGDDDRIKAIRNNPDIPVTLVCNAGEVFTYQDPGTADDAHGSFEFNRKRDLEILQRIDLHPGVTLPARIIYHRIWDNIENVEDICNCGEMESDKCKGCHLAKSGSYEKGREISLKYAVPHWNTQLNFSEADLPAASLALIIPRTREERAEAKKASIEAMKKADAISVRPHILLCAICQYGQGSRPPFETDNLPEMLQYILKNPKAKIRIAQGADWMMCAPCPSLSRYGACLNVKGHCGLGSQLRDVRVLQKLELSYGDVINARELYKKIMERIPSSAMICGSISKGVPVHSVWEDECGHHEESLPEYVSGREQLIKEFGFKI